MTLSPEMPEAVAAVQGTCPSSWLFVGESDNRTGLSLSITDLSPGLCRSGWLATMLNELAMTSIFIASQACPANALARR